MALKRPILLHLTERDGEPVCIVNKCIIFVRVTTQGTVIHLRGEKHVVVKESYDTVTRNMLQ